MIVDTVCGRGINAGVEETLGNWDEGVDNKGDLNGKEFCDAPKPGGPLTTRQPAEYKWRSGYPTPL